MTDPFDACRAAYEQGQRDALAAAVQRVEVLYSKGHFIWDDGIESYGIPHKRDVMTAIKGDQ